MSRYFSSLILLSAFAGACAVSEGGRPDGGAEGERGAIGKADGVGSCALPNGNDFCVSQPSGRKEDALVSLSCSSRPLLQKLN